MQSSVRPACPLRAAGAAFASRHPGSSPARFLGRVLPEALGAAGLGANRMVALSASRAAASGPREAEARAGGGRGGSEARALLSRALAQLA